MTKTNIFASQSGFHQGVPKDGTHIRQFAEVKSKAKKHKPKSLVFVVDDQVTGRKILTQLLCAMEPKVSVHAFSDPRQALKAAEELTPVLVLTDYRMPQMDGAEFIRKFRKIKSCNDVPLIVVTVCDDLDIRYKALDAGATDFLTRPLDQYECRVRCRNLLKLGEQQRLIKSKTSWLQTQVSAATESIRQREYETLMRLTRASEYRDEETGTHVLRIAKFSRLIAEALGFSEADCHEIELAAPMHDIGKVGVSDAILLKAGELNIGEYELMKHHTIVGHQILKDSPSKYLQLGAEIALHHHEKWDGTGYSKQLKGEAIPIAARIVAVADVFDALCSNRPYKTAWQVEDAFAYLRKESGTHFDPVCVDAFLRNIDEILDINARLRD